MREKASHLSRYADIFIINILGLVIGLILYYKTKEKIEVIGAVLASTISISIGVRSYKIEDDKIFKDLFESFNKTYDEKFNEKLNAIHCEDSDVKEEGVIIDYLNFCAEEYLWYTKDRIPYRVWNAWRAGMLFHFRKPAIKKIIEKERIQKTSYYGLFDNVTDY